MMSNYPPLDLLTPQRSPSRLDFCIDDIPDQMMDWFCAPSHGNSLNTCDDAPPSFLMEDDPLLATNSHPDDNIDSPPLFFAPSDPEPMEEVVIKPQVPTPVRPPSVQILVDGSESTPPSRVTPQRLNYPHHGFSRSALLQQKTLWNSRQAEWVEWESRTEKSATQNQESNLDGAYTGLDNSQLCAPAAPPPCMRTPPSGLERDSRDHPPLRKREPNVRASIYPRMGDISALRDPYVVNIDRSFFMLPSWTLHKALYTFDLHRSASLVAPAPAPACNAEHVEASASSSTLSSYSPSTSGEDEESDSTLVADDSPVPKGRYPLEPLSSASSPPNPLFWNDVGGWEFSWYARWDVLVGIFQPYRPTHDAFEFPVEWTTPVEAKATPPSPPDRIVRFTIGDSEDDGEDDEEEDYGTPLADPGFGTDFDEACERALAFYHRELKFPKGVP